MIGYDEYTCNHYPNPSSLKPRQLSSAPADGFVPGSGGGSRRPRGATPRAPADRRGSSRAACCASRGRGSIPSSTCRWSCSVCRALRPGDHQQFGQMPQLAGQIARAHDDVGPQQFAVVADQFGGQAVDRQQLAGVAVALRLGAFAAATAVVAADRRPRRARVAAGPVRPASSRWLSRTSWCRCTAWAMTQIRFRVVAVWTQT